MYSHTGEQKVPFYKAAIITLMLSFTIFTAAPQDADAFILFLLGPIIAGSVIATIVFEAIIWCAIFCGSGGGGGGATQTCTEADVGRSCDSTIECPGGTWVTPGVTETFPATIEWASGSPTGVNSAGLQTGECQCVITGGLPVCTEVNYCGGGGGGAGVCGGCYDVENSNGGVLTSADEVTSAPPDSDCQFPLTPDSLIIDPAIAREGDPVNVSWDIGDNYPGNCSLTGPQITDPFSNASVIASNPRSLETGDIDITATGPHHYELTCTGAGTIKKDLKLLPDIQEI